MSSSKSFAPKCGDHEIDAEGWMVLMDSGGSVAEERLRYQIQAKRLGYVSIVTEDGNLVLMNKTTSVAIKFFRGKVLGLSVYARSFQAGEESIGRPTTCEHASEIYAIGEAVYQEYAR